MKPIVIIGAGMAGFTLARELRKLDKETPLIILTADSGGYYAKPVLSNAFAQNKLASQLITHDAVQMAAQLGATIKISTHVKNIDTQEKRSCSMMKRWCTTNWCWRLAQNPSV